MLKMIKYELRKNVKSLGILLLISALVESLFLYGLYGDYNAYTVVAMVLFGILAGVSYLFCLLYGVFAYYNDLRRKEGYLTFMAPVSYYGIVAAKIISTFLVALFLVAVDVALILINWQAAISKLGWKDSIEILKMILKNVTIADLSDIIGAIVIMIIYVAIQFFMYIVQAYFAISLTYTYFANNKHKGIISVVIYVVLAYAVGSIAVVFMNQLNLSDAMENAKSITGTVMIKMLPVELLYLAISGGYFFGTGWLLKKKISL